MSDDGDGLSEEFEEVPAATQREEQEANMTFRKSTTQVVNTGPDEVAR